MPDKFKSFVDKCMINLKYLQVLINFKTLQVGPS